MEVRRRRKEEVGKVEKRREEERKTQSRASSGFCGIFTATVCGVENSSTDVADAD